MNHLNDTHFNLISLFCILILTGCGHTPQTHLKAMPIGDLVDGSIKPAFSYADKGEYGEQRYRLAVGDRIEVRYLRQLEHNTTVTVGIDGTIMLPYLPSVVAAGKTLDELREYLEQQYLKLFNAAPTAGSKQYLIAVDDVLEIKFPFLGEYNTKVSVRPDGKISLPLIETIRVESKTPDDVEKELIDLYSKHLEHPVLVLNVVSSASNMVFADGVMHKMPLPGMDNIYLTLKSDVISKVYVAGEVVHPTAIAYQPMLTGLQAIVSVGGATDDGELASVVIIRKGDSVEPKYMVVDLLADIRGDTVEGDQNEAGKNRTAVTNDIVLKPFDVVIVPKTSIADIRDALDRYLYDLIPLLRNSSVGFQYTRSIGTQKVDQTTTNIESQEQR